MCKFIDPTYIMKSDALNKQVGGDHYTKFEIQPITVIHSLELGFDTGNIVKYVCRMKNPIEDLNKVLHYIDLRYEDCKEKQTLGLARWCTNIPPVFDVADAFIAQFKDFPEKAEFYRYLLIENPYVTSISVNNLKSMVEAIIRRETASC